ncbi:MULTISPECIES: hydroxymethylbilane synthase [Rhodomicrobium]|uniref:hydroxymethylbilane synthase n=1 Tax=Rhodomicrobium TaxID=1068 RepID=UPI000B4ABDAA|nr:MULTISPECIES: hydroxymethylbilane synthase [Rhodomicrobium]
MQSEPKTQALIRIGTRGSKLALAQAYQLRDRLIDAHNLTPDDFDIVIIKTSGDMITEKPLSEFGGKGLFTKEIEEALSASEIDLAVHSMKDMPTKLPDGLEISCFLPREDVRDAFISPKAASLSALAKGAVLGTSSLRRHAQVKRLRPDLKIINYRGNVDTRLRKLDENVADATLLAYAGLRRLGLEDRVTALIETDEMLPAVAQGAIGVETRIGDETMLRYLAPLHDGETSLCVEAERAFLAELDGSCRTPIAGLATLDGGTLRFRGQILLPDGSRSYQTEREGAAGDGAEMGVDAARELLQAAGPDFLRKVA